MIAASLFALLTLRRISIIASLSAVAIILNGVFVAITQSPFALAFKADGKYKRCEWRLTMIENADLEGHMPALRLQGADEAVTFARKDKSGNLRSVCRSSYMPPRAMFGMIDKELVKFQVAPIECRWYFCGGSSGR